VLRVPAAPRSTTKAAPTITQWYERRPSPPGLPASLPTVRVTGSPYARSPEGYSFHRMSDLTFTHLDPLGRARMVDVTPKEPTHRRAVARGRVEMQPATTAAIANREVKKGDVLAVARVAAIQASKRTSDMIPLCHPLLIGAVSVNFEIADDFVEVEVQVETIERTGVEMEALHACAVACLTIYDMCKSADKGMVIGSIALWEKTGGRSGTYRRADAASGSDPGDVAESVTNVVEP